MNRPLLAILLIGLAVPPVAWGGSQSDPEITDPEGDTRSGLTGLPTTSPDADLTGVWVVESAAEFEVHFGVADLGPVAATESHRWNATFTFEGIRLEAEVSRGIDGGSGGVRSPGYSGPSTATGTASVEFLEGTDQVVLRAPRMFTLTGVSGSIAVQLSEGSTLGSPIAFAHEGDATATVFVIVDGTARGRDFTFRSAAAPSGDIAVWTGSSAGNHVYATSIKFDGVEAGEQKGNGHIGTIEIRIADDTSGHRKMTFDGVTHTFSPGTLVTLHGYDGVWDAKSTNMNVKLIGAVESWSSS